MKIVNQSFVTASLEAALVGDTPAGVELDFHPEPLKGVPEEFRMLQITPLEPGPIDVTLAFKARGETPDPGGQTQVHFLLRCQVASHAP